MKLKTSLSIIAILLGATLAIAQNATTRAYSQVAYLKGKLQVLEEQQTLLAQSIEATASELRQAETQLTELLHSSTESTESTPPQDASLSNDGSKVSIGEKGIVIDHDLYANQFTLKLTPKAYAEIMGDSLTPLSPTMEFFVLSDSDNETPFAKLRITRVIIKEKCIVAAQATHYFIETYIPDGSVIYYTE